uniref:Ig-like domain-containing protein n=1 Tax=Salarias fasciatus TaxID=181472 RepID=A0A672GK41_SALFA
SHKKLITDQQLPPLHHVLLLHHVPDGGLLSVAVTQGQTDWGVNYGPPEICALKGSTVEIQSTFTYPLRKNGLKTTVEQMFWFIQRENSEPVDLRTDSQYAGRVRYDCGDRKCILSITDLTERDSAEYRFRFITNHPGGSFTGKPGVKLSVTDAPKPPSVSVSPSGEIVEGSSVTLTCSSDANPAASYSWYRGKQTLSEEQDGLLHFSSISDKDRGNYYCQSKNQHGQTNSTLQYLDVQYAPNRPVVAVSPSGEIMEGSSVALTCGSDASPAATYTWYKRESFRNISHGAQLNFTSIQPSDSGGYYCTAENKLGVKRSQYTHIDHSVKKTREPPVTDPPQCCLYVKMT